MHRIVATSGYTGHVILIVTYWNYVFLVPSIEEVTHYFLNLSSRVAGDAGLSWNGRHR
jgi:hypothetical protein